MISSFISAGYIIFEWMFRVRSLPASMVNNSPHDVIVHSNDRNNTRTDITVGRQYGVISPKVRCLSRTMSPPGSSPYFKVVMPMSMKASMMSENDHSLELSNHRWKNGSSENIEESSSDMLSSPKSLSSSLMNSRESESWELI